MTSKISWVVWPAPAMYVALKVPVALRATVTPLARLSPTGKLSVEVVGVLVGFGVSATAPGPVC